MYRKMLTLAVIALVIAGIAVSLLPFGSSLKPNDASLNRALHIDISDLKVGQTKEKKLGHRSLVIAKLQDDEFLVFAIPMSNGNYLLPEFKWSGPLVACQSFVQQRHFQCIDTFQDKPVWHSYMKWNHRGVYVGENKWGKIIPDLPRVKHKLVGRHLVVLG